MQHRFGDMERFPISGGVSRSIIDPLETVSGDLPPRLVHRRDDRLTIARHRRRHRIDGDGNRALGEQAV